MSRDLKQGLTMMAGALAGWLVGYALFAHRGWEITCLVIGIAAAQFLGRRLFPPDDTT